MILNALVILTATLLGPADTPRGDVVKKELEKFQGTWKYVSMDVEGKQQPGEVVKFTLIIKGDQWTVWAGQKIVAQARIKLDPNRKPRTIDLTSTLDADKGRLIRGIYSLEGDRLTMCDRGADRGERPTTFVTRPGSGLVLVVLQHLKK